MIGGSSVTSGNTGGRGARPGHAETVHPSPKEGIFRPLVSQNRRSLPDVRRRFGLQPSDPRMSSLAEGLGGRAQRYFTCLGRSHFPRVISTSSMVIGSGCR